MYKRLVIFVSNQPSHVAPHVAPKKSSKSNKKLGNYQKSIISYRSYRSTDCILRLHVKKYTHQIPVKTQGICVWSHRNERWKCIQLHNWKIHRPRGRDVRFPHQYGCIRQILEHHRDCKKRRDKRHRICWCWESWWQGAVFYNDDTKFEKRGRCTRQSRYRIWREISGKQPIRQDEFFWI